MLNAEFKRCISKILLFFFAARTGYNVNSACISLKLFDKYQYM